MEETVPPPGPPAKGGKPTGSRGKRALFATILILGFVVLPVCFTGGIFSVLWFSGAWTFGFGPEKQPEVQTLRLIVSKDANRPNAYRSINQALSKAEFDTVIELWDDVHEESVVFDGGRGGRTNITLQAAPGKEIVWKPGRNKDPQTPLLRLIKTPDFKLKGKGITFDGSLDKDRSVNDLIMITSDCSGLVIEDLQMRHFARDAVLIMNATGSANRPIRLERLWTITQEFEKPRAVIYFDANAKVIPPQNDHIEIRDCTFKGIDAESAIQFKDAPVRGEFIRLQDK
jgi:hypothetical protein